MCKKLACHNICSNTHGCDPWMCDYFFPHNSKQCYNNMVTMCLFTFCTAQINLSLPSFLYWHSGLIKIDLVFFTGFQCLYDYETVIKKGIIFLCPMPLIHKLETKHVYMALMRGKDKKIYIKIVIFHLNGHISLYLVIYLAYCLIIVNSNVHQG